MVLLLLFNLYFAEVEALQLKSSASWEVPAFGLHDLFCAQFLCQDEMGGAHIREVIVLCIL